MECLINRSNRVEYVFPSYTLKVRAYLDRKQSFSERQRPLLRSPSQSSVKGHFLYLLLLELFAKKKGRTSRTVTKSPPFCWGCAYTQNARCLIVSGEQLSKFPQPRFAVQAKRFRVHVPLESFVYMFIANRLSRILNNRPLIVWMSFTGRCTLIAMTVRALRLLSRRVTFRRFQCVFCWINIATHYHNHLARWQRLPRPHTPLICYGIEWMEVCVRPYVCAGPFILNSHQQTIKGIHFCSSLQHIAVGQCYRRPLWLCLVRDELCACMCEAYCAQCVCECRMQTRQARNSTKDR